MNIIILYLRMHQVFNKTQQIPTNILRVITNDIIEEILDYILFINVVLCAD